MLPRRVLAFGALVTLALPGCVTHFVRQPISDTKGVRIYLQGHQPCRAAVRAVHDTLKALRGGTPPGEIENVASGEDMKAFTRDGDYRRWMKDLLGGA